VKTYAQDAWSNYRTPDNLFKFSKSATRFELLDQGAMLQILATLAWDPGKYPMLA
jgi:hypothetical protein